MDILDLKCVFSHLSGVIKDRRLDSDPKEILIVGVSEKTMSQNPNSNFLVEDVVLVDGIKAQEDDIEQLSNAVLYP